MQKTCHVDEHMKSQLFTRCWRKAKSKKRAKSGSDKKCGKSPKPALIKYLFVFYIIIDEKYKN